MRLLFIVNTTNRIYKRERSKLVYSEYNKPYLRESEVNRFILNTTSRIYE